MTGRAPRGAVGSVRSNALVIPERERNEHEAEVEGLHARSDLERARQCSQRDVELGPDVSLFRISLLAATFEGGPSRCTGHHMDCGRRLVSEGRADFFT